MAYDPIFDVCATCLRHLPIPGNTDEVICRFWPATYESRTHTYGQSRMPALGWCAQFKPIYPREDEQHDEENPHGH